MLKYHVKDPKIRSEATLKYSKQTADTGREIQHLNSRFSHKQTDQINAKKNA
jgi:hypothetical protein